MKQTESSMDPQIRVQFAQLLRTFSDVFSKSEWDIGKCDLVQHKIEFYPDSKPLNYPLAGCPCISKSIYVKTYLTLAHQVYSSPTMLIPKKNGKLRLVIDYRQLNKQTVKSCWPLLPVEGFFDTLEGRCYFSSIDITWGFYQLPLETGSQDYTAFSTVLPLVLSNGFLCQWVSPGSSPVFQSLMEKVLVGLTWKSTIPYSDDCIIFSRTAEEHIQRLREVFQRFKDANLKSIRLSVSFSDNMCLSWVTLLVEMGFKPIQLKHQLCASIQYQNRLLRSKVSWDSVLTTDGTFAISQQLLDLFIS